MKIIVEIESCRQCPYFQMGILETTDGFDSGNNWTCTKANRLIAPFVEWHEVKKIEIPDWCPAKI